MSVYIKDHNENIYHITYSPDDLEPHSKEEGAPPLVAKDSETNLLVKKLEPKVVPDPRVYHPNALFGVSNAPKPDPHHFLKKGGGHILKAHHIPHHVKGKAFVVKHPVPETRKTVAEQMKKLAYKPPNMIARNVKEVLNQKPKVPKRIIVIDQYGTERNIWNEMDIKYTTAREFATLPKYIDEYKILTENRILAAKRQHDMMVQPKCMYITRDRRAKLLNGLKANWEELQGQYQALPTLTDTIPKKNRKTQMENQLRQLEKDIVYLERHQYLYVYEDDE